MTESAAKPPNRTDRGARFGLAVGLPVLMVLAAYVPFLAVRSELPDRVASHFGASGRPDGSMTVTMFLLVTSALVGAGVGLCIATSVKRPSEGALAATGGFLGGFIGGLGAGILASTSVEQRGLDDWRDASGSGWMLLVALSFAVVMGGLGARFAARLDTEPLRSSAVAVPVLDLAAGEEAVWMAVSRSTPMFVVGLGSLAGAVLIAVASSWSTGLVVLVSGLLVVTLSTFRLRADRTGLRVAYGLLPWPSTKVAIVRLERATVIDVRPMEWGGWGYRGSLKLMRRAAVVHRAGPGIRCDLTDGRVFVVTVDDPEVAVALLNAHVERAASSAL